MAEPQKTESKNYKLITDAVQAKALEEVLKEVKELATSKGTFIVNIGSLGCGPCISFEPRFRDAAKDMEEPFIALKLKNPKDAWNVSREIEKALGFDVKSGVEIIGTPCTFVITDGKLVGKPINGDTLTTDNLKYDLNKILSSRNDAPKDKQPKAEAPKATKDNTANVDGVGKDLGPDFAKLLATTASATTTPKGVTPEDLGLLLLEPLPIHMEKANKVARK